eukprot:11614762-Alexandrium_andersonii.AAC.1
MCIRDRQSAPSLASRLGSIQPFVEGLSPAHVLCLMIDVSGLTEFQGLPLVPPTPVGQWAA